MTKKQKNVSWIRLNDFAEMTLWITGVNTTTQIPIARDQRIELTEIGEKDITLSLPARSCATGHFLLLTIIKTQKLSWEPSGAKPPKISSPEDAIEFTAKVSDEIPLNNEMKAVTLTMFQVDENHWKRFIEQISKHQKTINQLVSNIRE